MKTLKQIVNSASKLLILSGLVFSSSLSFAHLQIDCPSVSEIQNATFDFVDNIKDTKHFIASTETPKSYGTSGNWYITAFGLNSNSLTVAKTELAAISTLTSYDRRYVPAKDKTIDTCVYMKEVTSMPNFVVVASSENFNFHNRKK